MRIGELLVRRHGLADRAVARALETQRRRSMRLASMLVEMGALDFDEASRALGELRAVPSVQAKHLAARDRTLARLVPPDVAHGEHVLPIGRASNASLIAAVRDPTPELRAMLQRVAGEPVTLAIMPATRLDALIIETYGEEVEGFDVDLGSAVGSPSAPVPAVGVAVLDPEAIQLSLADLDDIRVTKDPSQSGNINMAALRSALPPPPPPFDTTLHALEQATSRDAATEAAIPFLVGRFAAVAVLAIRGRKAIGYRGHGPAMGELDSLAIDLDAPSTVQRALDTRRSAIQAGQSAAQDALAARLGTPTPSAAPIVVAGTVVAVIVVGDPLHGFGETERSLLDLNRLAAALGGAYERIAGRQ